MPRSHPRARWSLAQYPNLVVPGITIVASAAPAATFRLLIISLCLGAAVLRPSLAFLCYLFKSRRALKARAQEFYLESGGVIL